MTDEQIAELRGFYDRAPQKLTAWFGSWPEAERTFRYVNACVAVTPRLLDEREALLRAMYQLRDGVYSSEFVRGHAAEAITRAEKP